MLGLTEMVTCLFGCSNPHSVPQGVDLNKSQPWDERQLIKSKHETIPLFLSPSSGSGSFHLSSSLWSWTELSIYGSWKCGIQRDNVHTHSIIPGGKNKIEKKEKNSIVVGISSRWKVNSRNRTFQSLSWPKYFSRVWNSAVNGLPQLFCSCNSVLGILSVSWTSLGSKI